MTDVDPSCFGYLDVELGLNNLRLCKEQVDTPARDEVECVLVSRLFDEVDDLGDSALLEHDCSFGIICPEEGAVCREIFEGSRCEVPAVPA